MNKPISIIIAGTVLGSLITTTSYATSTLECQDARKDHAKVMCVIQSCKASLPNGQWVCDPELSRSAAKVMKKDCKALFLHECRGFPEPVGGDCDPDVLAPPVPSCPSVVGTWAVSLDTDCDGVGDVNRTNIYHGNFTWNAVGFPNGGPWTQKCCEIEMADDFFNPPLIWNGTLNPDGDQLSGTYSGIFNGCWTATRLTPIPPPDDGLALPASEPELRPGDEYYLNQ